MSNFSFKKRSPLQPPPPLREASNLLEKESFEGVVASPNGGGWRGLPSFFYLNKAYRIENFI